MKNFSKKLSAAAMAAVVAAGIAPCAAGANVKWGDINGDGNIDILDIVIMRDHIVNGTPIEDKSYLIDDSNNTTDLDNADYQIGLDRLHIIDSSINYKYDDGSVQDTYGNIYIGAHLFGYNYSGDSYAIYNLNKEYSTFSGTIVALPELESCAYADYYFYVDDVLVYSQTQQEKTTIKKNFKIDVSGATKLTIKVKTYLKPNIVAVGYLGLGCIVDAQLSK